MRLTRLLAITALAGLLALPARAEGWQEDWQRTIEAAKRERQLVISGPSGTAWREQLLTFNKDYPFITLDITPAAAREFWPRVVKEREAGQKLWDFRVGGPDHSSYVMLHQGVIAPIRPLLVLPEVVDPGAWYGGFDGLFLDTDRSRMLGFAVYDEDIAFYNGRLLPDPDIADMKNVILPKFAGKIAIADPRAGSSLTSSGVLLRAYGEDFLRRLWLEQKPVVTKEARQQMDWLASGRYPISFGIPTAALVEYAARGASIAEFKKIGGPMVWTQGVGGVQMLEGAPHPNATKLYVNWLLTRDVQARIMQAVKLNSRRKDVPVMDPENAVEYDHIDDYIGGQTEAMDPYQQKAAELLKQLMP
jgi:iron(III) transport system substrate-binding protein